MDLENEIGEHLTTLIKDDKCYWCRCISDALECGRAFNGDGYADCLWKH